MNETFLRAYRAAEIPDSGPIPFVAATEGMKRDGLDVRMAGADLGRFKANPVILWAHNPTLPPIARGDVSVDGSHLLVNVEFDQEDEFARSVESKYRRGFLNAVSAHGVATSPVRRGVMESWELVEISALPVPCDPEALTTMARTGMRHLGRELLDLGDLRRELSTNDKRDRLYNLITERFGGGERTWVWVRDFGDDWVVYEIENDQGCTTWRLGYTVDAADDLTLDPGDPAEVEVTTRYEPVGTPAADAPASSQDNTDDETVRSLIARLEAEGFQRSTPATQPKDLSELQRFAAAFTAPGGVTNG